MMLRFGMGFFHFSGLFFLLLQSNSCTHSPSDPPLRIATAANAQFAMAEIVETFTAQTQISCEVIVGSSGKLTAQIQQGAPYDIFLSANMKYPEKVYIEGYAFQKPQIYAYGKLILWAIDPSIPLNLNQLDAPKIEHIAIANPRNAPYGQAAWEVLEKSSRLKDLKPKLVYGESISQCNQFVLSGGAQVAFTAKSVALSPQLRERGNWKEIPDSLYTPIAQGAILLKKKEQAVPTKDAQAFFEFLFTAEVKGILGKYGYQSNF